MSRSSEHSCNVRYRRESAGEITTGPGLRTAMPTRSLTLDLCFPKLFPFRTNYSGYTVYNTRRLALVQLLSILPMTGGVVVVVIGDPAPTTDANSGKRRGRTTYQTTSLALIPGISPGHVWVSAEERQGDRRGKATRSIVRGDHSPWNFRRKICECREAVAGEYETKPGNRRLGVAKPRYIR